MKSKFLAAFLLVNLALLLVNGYAAGINLNGADEVIAVLGNPGSKLTILDEELVKSYFRAEKKSDARTRISSITLSNLGLEQWLSFPGLKVIIKKGDVYPTPGQELFVALSAGKDNGVIAVYALQSGGYDLIDKISNLVPITGLTFVELPEYPLKALVVKEYLDERVGAFFQNSTVSIFAWKKTLHKVWEGESFHEEVWNTAWEGKEPGWIKLEEKVKIKFVNPGEIERIVETKYWQAKAGEAVPPEEDFTKTGEKNFREIYLWNNKKFSFILTP